MGVLATMFRRQSGRRGSLMGGNYGNTNNGRLSNVSNTATINEDVSLFTESINVVVRCRGRGVRENELNSPNVVYTSTDRPTEVQINMLDNNHNENSNNNTNTNNDDKNSDISSTKYKTYKLDHVYGPSVDQMTFFQSAAENICNDFIKGYNCTIFAYGQTSAGKTYTMCGKNNGNLLTPESGIIPRCLNKLFEDLKKNKDKDDVDDENILKCSFVEIYNETLRDLLSDGNNDKLLKIYEKDKIIKINSLEEFYIKDFNEAMKIFHMGLNKKKIASTKMNENSSRSHTIFTVYLMKKKHNNKSEYQFSKINLVDLAGSENINRSGSMNQRAKEAGSINQSLLTLGRVINSLVDGSNFIPYRESKLTRLLQDSLGGKTKTMLIANISPTLIDLNSSISTLEYASKAKNIKNSSQIGTIINEDYLLSEMIEENRKLKLDLMATRKRENCIIMDENNYKEMYLIQKNLRDEVDELKGLKLSLMKQLEFQINKINVEKDKNDELVNNLTILENKIIESKNIINENMHNENTLKLKIDQLTNQFNEKIIKIKKRHHNIKSILNNKIMNQINLLNKELNTDNVISMKSLTSLKDEINKFDELIKEINNKNDESIESMSSILTYINNYKNNNEIVETHLMNINAKFDEKMNNDFKFHKFLNNELKEDKKEELFSSLNDNIKDVVDEFKKEMNEKISLLMNESFSVNYKQFLKFYQDKILTKDKEWDDNNTQNMKEIQEIHGSLTNVIKSGNEEVHGVFGNIRNAVKDSVYEVKDKVNEVRDNFNIVNKNIEEVEEEMKVHEKYTSDKVDKYKETITELGKNIGTILENHMVEEEEGEEEEQEEENNDNKEVLKVIKDNSKNIIRTSFGIKREHSMESGLVKRQCNE